MSARYLSILLASMALAACQANKKDELVSSDSTTVAELIERDGEETTADQSEDVAEVETAQSESTGSVQAENTQEADTPGGDAVDETVKTANISSSMSSKNSVASYVAPKKGTVFTWRNNWANLPEIISYKVAGKVKNGDTEYLKLTSVKGFKNTTHAYYLTKDFSLKGYRDKSDKAVMSFKPTEKRYRFPMQPGDKWVTSWKQIDHKTKKVTSGGGVVRVMGWEVLDLPAGRFKTLKVRMPVQKNAPKGLTHYTWFSPKLGVTVKEEIGGGILSWSQILEKVEYPG